MAGMVARIQRLAGPDSACNCQVQRQDDAEVAPVADVVGKGTPRTAVAYGGPANVALRGRTNATFNAGAFRTEGVTTEQGESCSGCRAGNCVHVTGSIVTDYAVTTSVTLPPMSRFRRLTPCQRERVREAIDNTLAPHEQEHVAAFEQYNGSSTQEFDLTTCRAAFPRAIRNMVTAEETPRRAAAQAASDALDPFQVDVDLNCSEESSE